MNKYIEIDDKKRAKHTFDQWHDDYVQLNGAGIFLGDDVVLVDFDGHNNKERYIVEAILLQYPTLQIETSRGCHLYYKKPRGINIPNVAQFTSLSGLKVDYKNGNQYGIIKINGEERKRNKDEINLDDLPELPIVLYPYLKNGDCTTDLKERTR